MNPTTSNPATARPDADLRVTIAVPTFKRPDRWARLLPLLIEQLRPWDGQVLIVDNDPARTAQGVADGEPRARYVSEPRPGLSNVRNRALDETVGVDLVQFIDDDEVPEADWLAHMIGTWRATGATAVAGRVLPSYDGEPDPWLVAGGFFVRRSLPTGTVVPTAPTSNLLIDRHQVEDFDLRFDPRFGLTGGEDTMFSTQLTAAGGTIVFCDEAAVYDEVPRTRMTRRWVLTRAMSHGNTTGYVRTLVEGGRARPALLFGGLARALAGAGRAGFGLVTGSQEHQAKGARRAARGLGVASAAFDLAFEEYSRNTSRRGRFVRRTEPEPALAGGTGPKRFARTALAPIVGSLTRFSGPAIAALTYDDGPDPDVTPAVLDVLARHGATATFFVLAGRARQHPDIVRRMVDEGHDVALHGLAHRRWTDMPADKVFQSVREGISIVEGLTQQPVRWVRPPHGALTVAHWRSMRRLGVEVAMWSATVRDSHDMTAADRSALVAEAVVPGRIVLAHDGEADSSSRTDRVALAEEICVAAHAAGVGLTSFTEAMRRGARPHRDAIFTWGNR